MEWPSLGFAVFKLGAMRGCVLAVMIEMLQSAWRSANLKTVTRWPKASELLGEIFLTLP